MWVKLYKLLFILMLFALSVETFAAESIKAEVRYLYVQPGQTLHNIVSKLYPNID